MEINRALVLEKLGSFLQGQLSKNDIYEWALFVAVSKEYDAVASQDLLLSKTIQAMVDINHADIQNIPTEKYLAYLEKCLRGEEEFVLGEEMQAKLESHQAEQRKEEIVLSVFRDAPPQHRQYLFIIRVYVSMFAACALLINFYSITHPQAFAFGKAILSRFAVMNSSLPYILHSVFMLLPTKKSAQDPFFYLALLIQILGTFNYWYLAGQIVVWLGISKIFLLSIVPFTSLPPTLALLLLLLRRLEIHKHTSSRPLTRRKIA